MTDSIRPRQIIGAAAQQQRIQVRAQDAAARTPLPDGVALLRRAAAVPVRGIARSGGELAPQSMLDGVARVGPVKLFAPAREDPFAGLVEASHGAFRGILGGGPVDDLFGR